MARNEHDQSTSLDARRLLDAADLLLNAAQDRPDGLSLIDLWTEHDGDAPVSSFSSDELIEAMLFLFRLGLAEPRV